MMLLIIYIYTHWCRVNVTVIVAEIKITLSLINYLTLPHACSNHFDYRKQQHVPRPRIRMDKSQSGPYISGDRGQSRIVLNRHDLIYSLRFMILIHPMFKVLSGPNRIYSADRPLNSLALTANGAVMPELSLSKKSSIDVGNGCRDAVIATRCASRITIIIFTFLFTYTRVQNTIYNNKISTHLFGNGIDESHVNVLFLPDACESKSKRYVPISNHCSH